MLMQMINRASKQNLSCNTQIVIAKIPKHNENTLFVPRKNQITSLPTYKSVLLKSTLNLNLCFPRTTYIRVTYLFLTIQIDQ